MYTIDIGLDRVFVREKRIEEKNTFKCTRVYCINNQLWIAFRVISLYKYTTSIIHNIVLYHIIMTMHISNTIS